MKRLLMTTALVSALAGAAAAQDTSAILVPDGYAAYQDVGRLTFDVLDGATVYDVRGESLGEISDLVFATDMSTTQGSGSTMTGDGAATTGTAGTMATGTAATGTAAGTATEGMATDTTATGTAATTGATDDIAATAEQAAEEITDTATAAIEDIADATDTAQSAVAQDGTTGGTGTAGTPGAGAAAMDGTTPVATTVDGQVSHVVVDIGGFLGLGGHTVAVPIEALAIYADGGNQLQIFLPWTEDQLRDLPAYVAGDASTLGRMTTTGG